VLRLEGGWCRGIDCVRLSRRFLPESGAQAAWVRADDAGAPYHTRGLGRRQPRREARHINPPEAKQPMLPDRDARCGLLALLDAYAAREPGSIADVAIFRVFCLEHADCFERYLAIGHFTGAAWLVSADGERVLLTHHRKLDRWLQLGGHADGDPDLAAVALKEAEEESGLRGLVVEPALFDLDRHWIPRRPGEPGHWHYDARFVIRANSDECFVVSGESHALEWRPIAAMVDDATLDASLRRMARKWLARC